MELQKVAILELLKYNDQHELLAKLKDWSIPRFPLNGPTLLANGCPPGKDMGIVQTKLRDLWKDSSFALTQDELLKQLPEVVNAMVKAKPSPPKKRKEAKN